MLYYLQELSEWWGPFRLFDYVMFRSFGAAVTAFLASLYFGPKVIRMLTRLKLGQPIRGKEEVHKLAELHGGKAGTPTMGGMLILIVVTIGTLMWGNLENPYIWGALVPTLAFGGLGFIDDFAKIRKKQSEGLTSKQKLFGQILISVAVGIFLLTNETTAPLAKSLEVPFLKDPVIANMGWWALFFFTLVIVGSSNAVNLTDGLDGLAIGCTLSAVGVFAAFCYVCSHAVFADHLDLPRTPGTEELVVFCAAIMGAGLGFLWFNCHPAQVFMGDTGSLALGGALGVVSICVNQELLLVIVGGVFVMEAMSVILQVASFKLTGKRIFAMSPIHHHFELKGWSETSVVVRFWILSLVFALMGLATLKLR